MASQSSLRMRVATIQDLLAPDTSKRPCIAVRINRVPPTPPGPLLLTAGEEPPAETHAPAEPTEARKRHDGHVCGPHCVSLSINFTPRWEGSNAGAHSGSGRGDVQRLPESAAVGRDVEPQSDPPPSPARAAGAPAGRDEGLQEIARIQAEYEAGNWGATVQPPARDAVVEMERRRVSVPLGAPPPQLGPEDVVGGPEPHGPCAIPWCGHPLEAHRCFTERLPCRFCNWPVTAHDGTDTRLPYAARRLWPCGVYLSIAFEGGEQDGCSEVGCTCPGWRRTAPYVSERQEAIRALREEQERGLARGKRELEEARAQLEALQREALRAQGSRSLGADPHGCPVYTDEVTR